MSRREFISGIAGLSVATSIQSLPGVSQRNPSISSAGALDHKCPVPHQCCAVDPDWDSIAVEDDFGFHVRGQGGPEKC